MADICIEQIWLITDARHAPKHPGRCSRKATKGQYCWQHDPAHTRVDRRETQGNYIRLRYAASRAFQTASEKMGKKCPVDLCEDGQVPTGYIDEPCQTCKGTGTVGPSPLALAEWAQNGEIAELVKYAFAHAKGNVGAPDGPMTFGEYTLLSDRIDRILAKIPGG